ncbi:hypothetical protein [Bartonella senegalensis]|uniref:hypothetical protein n=1 Tax=Bartonella senegalensis TaxID=1468418 RepID=UPI0002F2BC51|nr:hypothetical protein [Bartonella senegalensis]
MAKKLWLVIYFSKNKPIIRVMVEGDEREVLEAIVTEMVGALAHHDALVGACALRKCEGFRI